MRPNWNVTLNAVRMHFNYFPVKMLHCSIRTHFHARRLNTHSSYIKPIIGYSVYERVTDSPKFRSRMSSEILNDINCIICHRILCISMNSLTSIANRSSHWHVDDSQLVAGVPKINLLIRILVKQARIMRWNTNITSDSRKGKGASSNGTLYYQIKHISNENCQD